MAGWVYGGHLGSVLQEHHFDLVEFCGLWLMSLGKEGGGSRMLPPPRRKFVQQQPRVKCQYQSSGKDTTTKTTRSGDDEIGVLRI